MKPIKLFLISLFIFLFSAENVFAVYDPTSVPNNIYGVHILFPDEIFQAKNLVNSKNGDWGYVTIPIQASDRDLDKWQTFMDDCRQLHLIPILRLATNGDYFNTKFWEKPTPNTVLDFSNFLNSLNWPTRNRYVVIFNEVNRADEWGGNVSPIEYSNILNYAVDTFKSKNPDFFVISAGLDNAAPQKPPDYMNEYEFLQEMEAAVPGVFSKLDGLASHSYPNPGFSQPSYINTKESIYSFMYESGLADNYAGKKLPVFITETGWSQTSISQDQLSVFFQDAFQNVWDNKDIVAVTPFLLRGNGSSFSQFSFIKDDGDENSAYKKISSIEKTAGKPQLTQVKIEKSFLPKLPIRNFLYEIESQNKFLRAVNPTKIIFKWLLKV